MTNVEYTFFRTPIGKATIAWTQKGIVLTRLPDESLKVSRDKLLKKYPDAKQTLPPKAVREVILKIQKHLAGTPQNFRLTRLDLRLIPPFHAKVYEHVIQIPKGKVQSYLDVASMIGSPKAPRAVGQAMAQNPFPIVVPCHRVIASRGEGGFSAYGGLVTKDTLLRLEGGELPRASDFEKLPRSFAKILRHIESIDPQLKKLLKRVGPPDIRPQNGEQVFETLARAIIFQQLAGKAARSIYSKFIGVYGDGPLKGTYGKLNVPKILKASVEDLRKVGLSRTKALSIQDLCRKKSEGSLAEFKDFKNLSNQQIVERLTAVRGVGPWTVQMYLMFNLGRADVLPSTDYGVQKGFQKLYGLKTPPTPKQLAKAAEKWRPYRTVVSWYLWRALEID